MLSWRILSPSSTRMMYCLSKTHTLSSTTIAPSRDPTASLRLPEIQMDKPLKSEFELKPNSDVIESTSKKMKKDVAPGDQDEEEEEQISISRIQVPRQKYISVSKVEFLDAIVSVMFHSQDDRDQFLLIASCLDSILHAEHKSILEEMRSDYFFTDSVGGEESVTLDTKLVNIGKENKSAHVVNTESSDPDNDIINRNGSTNKYGNDEGEKTEPNELPPFNYGLDLWNLIGTPAKNVEKYNESRLAVATRFQRAFMQLLNNAQFEELSVTDLVLTSALNTDYLLTLPIYIDWKRASESNAIIFRRGYATERQKGLLIVEKLDYIQSRFLQKIFIIISKSLEKVGKWISEVLTNASQTQEVQDITKRMKSWLKELTFSQQSHFSNEETSESMLGADQLSDDELPIWLAAQKAVSRYEGFLSPVGPRGRLLRKLLTLIGFTSPTSETTFQLETNSNASEPYLRPISLSRISLSDIWRPASRKYCGNDLWKIFKTSVSILLSKSMLQEPTFEELILLYTSDIDKKETKDKTEVPPMQLKIYERIPIPDLPVIFPHKKLSFRIIDTVRLDVATIVGLLAFFINYKFEDILSSPSAVFLDVIAITALILYITRVVLGYKQTRDRYELLVNKTLYEKTLASGFGSVHFLLDASEQQLYKEAILTYAILLNEETCQGICHQTVGNKCEKFMYDVLEVKVEMPIEKAVKLLVRLGMVSEISIDGRYQLQATPCSKAYEALKERWNGLLG